MYILDAATSLRVHHHDLGDGDVLVGRDDWAMTGIAFSLEHDYEKSGWVSGDLEPSGSW